MGVPRSAEVPGMSTDWTYLQISFTWSKPELGGAMYLR